MVAYSRSERPDHCCSPLLSLRHSLGKRAERLILGNQKSRSTPATAAVARGAEAHDCERFVAEFAHSHSLAARQAFWRKSTKLSSDSPVLPTVILTRVIRSDQKENRHPIGMALLTFGDPKLYLPRVSYAQLTDSGAECLAMLNPSEKRKTEKQQKPGGQGKKCVALELE